VRPPRFLLISLSVAVLGLLLAMGVAGCGGGDDTNVPTRNAAGDTSASVLPPRAFITTQKTGNSGGAKIVRCELP